MTSNPNEVAPPHTRRVRKTVLTIHGVNTTGKWQEALKEVLEPHFLCRSIKYRGYRYLFGLQVIVSPWAALALVLALLWTAIQGLPRSPIGAASFLVSTTLLAVVAVLEPVWRRQRTRKRIKTECSAACVQGDLAPHVIAHSFGTFLLATTLDYVDVKFQRIVLSGTVLRREFPWEKHFRAKSFEHVRNECGTGDWVVYLAAKLSRIIKEFGSAGLDGFESDSYPAGFCHRISDPRRPCPECPSSAGLHNVHQAMNHTGVFYGIGHAANVWLPYLWGFESSEYAEFVRLCQDAAEREAIGPRSEFVKIEQQFRDACWSWTDNRPLHAFLRDELELLTARTSVDPSRISRLVDRAVPLVWHGVVAAFQRRGERLTALGERRGWSPRGLVGKERGVLATELPASFPAKAESDDIILSLHPWTAMTRAAYAVVGEPLRSN